MEDIFLLDIPMFSPDYQKGTLYGYSGNARKNLDELLRKASKNHCMYCYALLKSDRVNTGNLEHGIEKDMDKEHLTDCVPNIAIACTHCNQSLKRIGEKNRKEKMHPSLKIFKMNVQCQTESCIVGCDAFAKLKQAYCRESQIILQPFGVKGQNSGLDYRIQYDVEKAEFVPSRKYKYDAKDLAYIEHHIHQFRMNDIGFKTRALLEFLEDVISAEGRYRKEKEYSNYIVDLFVEKMEGYTQEEVYRICSNLYVRYFLMFKG